MNAERSLVNLTGKLRVLIYQRLWLQVLMGMFAGIGVGLLIGPTAGLVEPYAAVLIGNWAALPGKLISADHTIRRGAAGRRLGHSRHRGE